MSVGHARIRWANPEPSVASTNLVSAFKRGAANYMPRHPDAAVNDQQAVKHQDDSLCSRHAGNLTKGVCGELPKEAFYLSEDGAYVPPRNGRYLRIANLLAGCSVSRLPYRLPRLYGLFLELRSFLHRIRLVWRRGGTCFLETGPVYQQTFLPSPLALNRQTQLRTHGIQRLLSDCPWLSGEDCYLFLMGWNVGWESCDGLDTAKSSADTGDSFTLQTENARQETMLRLAVQQWPKCGPSNQPPLRA